MVWEAVLEDGHTFTEVNYSFTTLVTIDGVTTLEGSTRVTT